MSSTQTRCLIPRGLLDAIARAPHDDTARLVAADWCGDHLDGWAEEQLRHGPPPVGLVFDGDGYGDGYGYGYGDGDGDGYGDGYGYGDGDGDGDGYGSLTLTLGGRVMPELGKNQLIILPHGWVICGFVAEQVGPYQFAVRNASVISRTGGTPWDELADGKKRNTATFRFWGDVTIGPQFVMSRDWVGQLPEKK